MADKIQSKPQSDDTITDETTYDCRQCGDYFPARNLFFSVGGPNNISAAFRCAPCVEELGVEVDGDFSLEQWYDEDDY